jgi:hypothetical protein
MAASSDPTPGIRKSVTQESFTIGEKFMDYFILLPQPITPQFIEQLKGEGVKVLVNTTKDRMDTELLRRAEIEFVQIPFEAKFPLPADAANWLKLLSKSYKLASVPDKKFTLKFTIALLTTDLLNKGPLLACMALLFRGYNLAEALYKVRRERRDAISVDYFEYLVRWNYEDNVNTDEELMPKRDCVSWRKRDAYCTMCVLF